MGRIKTMLVKRTTKKLFQEHKGEFTTDFAQNKKIVSSFITTPSKKIVNTVTGYVTRLTKTTKEL